jgi:hypothetical protein
MPTRALPRRFTYADGPPIRPEYLTHRFRQLCKELGLPPILLHGAATLALASHTDLKIIQQMLGHSSIVTTADTYTSVLAETAHRARPVHRRHGHESGPDRSWGQARRVKCDPHPGRCDRVRLLPDVSSRSSNLIGTRHPGPRREPAVISRETRA